MGSNSTVLKLEAKAGAGTNQNQSTVSTSSSATNRQRLELYSSGEIPLTFGFMHRKFDTAMVAFLECLRQLGEFVEQTPDRASSVSMPVGGRSGTGSPGPGAAVKMPYEIKKDRIHDQSIKLSVSKDENWTKACKYTLTCCKYLLAHANNVESLAMRRGR